MADAAAINFYGLHELIGYTVTAWIAGLDCGEYVVGSDGGISVPFGVDPDGLFTPAYLAALAEPVGGWGLAATTVDVWYQGHEERYNIPVVIGFKYTTQGQVVRPVGQDELKSKEGNAFGVTRRVHMIGALVSNCVGGEFGTDFTNNIGPALYRNAAQSSLDHTTMYSGVYWDTIEDGYSFDGMLCWRQTRPYPMTICAIGGFLHTQER